MNKSKSFHIPLLFFHYLIILFAAMSLHGYFILNQAYFNEVCCDSLKQVSHFYPFLQEAFSNGNFFWSWRYGLGGDVYGQFSYYYTTSPLFWITLLFDLSTLEAIFEFRLVISIGKLFLAMVFMYHLLTYLKRSSTASIIGSFIYGGSLYFTFYSLRYDFMVDGMVWLPLVILGFEKYVQQGHRAFFLTSLFLMLSSNFYLAYMNSIFIGIYVFFTYFSSREVYSIKDFLLYIGRFFGLYFIGLGLAAVAFLPAVYAYLHVDRFYYDVNIPLLFDMEFYKQLPYQLFFFADFTMFIVVMPIITGVVFLYGLFLKNKPFRVRYLFSLFICLLVLFPITYSIFNGFSVIQYRWLYMFVFAVALAISFILDQLVTEPAKKGRLVYFGVILGLLFIGLLVKFELTGFYVRKLDLVFLAFAFAIAALLSLNQFVPRKIVSSGLVLVVLANISLTNHHLFQTFLGDAEKLNDTHQEILENRYVTEDETRVFDFLEQKDSSFYRILWEDVKDWNSPLLYGYRGMGAYNSLLSGDVHLFIKKEYNTLQTNAPSLFSNVDNRLYLETVLGTKYYIVHEENDYVPYGYKKIEQFGGHQIFENQYSLPIGFLYDTVVSRDTFETLHFSERDQLLLHAAVMENVAGVTLPIFDTENLSVNLQRFDEDDVEVENISIKNGLFHAEQGAKVIIPLDRLEGEFETLLDIAIKEVNGNSFTISDGKKYFKSFGDSIYNYPKEHIVINRGSDQQDKIILTLSPGTYDFDRIIVSQNPLEAYEDLIAKKQLEAVTDITFTEESVSGKIDATRNGILFLSVPYSKGWTVTVDGKKVDTYKVNSAFTGVYVTEGEHVFEMKYVTPYFKEGLMISVGTFLLLIFILRKRRRINERG
ncbi:YfhO family protein [Bacillus timonensis]|nr:YfhO family protein [Bacillus timonensis]